MFKKKKELFRDLVILIIPIVVLILAIGYFLYKDVKSIVPDNSSKEEVVDDAFTISEYDYHLRNNATEFQKTKFKELKDAFSSEVKDDELIAGLVVENFVSDLYTMTNKTGAHDVGGLYYVYSPQRILYFNDVKQNFYSQLTKLIKEYGNDNLLEVISTSVETTKSDDIEIDGKTYPNYSVKCNWEYKDSTFDTESFVDKQYFQVYKLDNGRFEIFNQVGDANE